MSPLVIDWGKSETGPQRRRTAAGRLLHCCCICGRLDTWGLGWSCFCSERELDDEMPIPKFCSEGCREKGGPDAVYVTAAMKQAAKAAEWRAPTIRYREATDAEKYADARAQQRQALPSTEGLTEE